MNLPKTILDENKYPTQEALIFVRKYVPSIEYGILPFLRNEFREFFYDPYRSLLLEKKRDESIAMTIHTDGWSGNEDVVNAMLNNITFTDYPVRYVKWLRGGHYYFEIDAENLKK